MKPAHVAALSLIGLREYLACVGSGEDTSTASESDSEGSSACDGENPESLFVGSVGSRAGSSIAGVGDGDGVTDVIIGAPGGAEPEFPDEPGRAWVFSASAAHASLNSPPITPISRPKMNRGIFRRGRLLIFNPKPPPPEHPSTRRSAAVPGNSGVLKEEASCLPRGSKSATICWVSEPPTPTMSPMLHGNSGFRVKNLRGTSGCPHYTGLSASALSRTKCATNGCKKFAIRACHVIAANQNSDTGIRLIVYLCASCNGIYDEALDVRINAIAFELRDCDCGCLSARRPGALRR